MKKCILIKKSLNIKNNVQRLPNYDTVKLVILCFDPATNFSRLLLNILGDWLYRNSVQNLLILKIYKTTNEIKKPNTDNIVHC